MFFRSRVEQSATTAGPEGRRSGRLLQKLLLCNFGQILDLSATGLRIGTRRKTPKVGETIEIILDEIEMPVQIFARVVWTRRIGVFNHEMGLELTDADPQIVRFLGNVASTDIRHMPYSEASN